MVTNEIHAAHRLGEAFLTLLKATQGANATVLNLEMQQLVKQASTYIQDAVKESLRNDVMSRKEQAKPEPLLVGARQAAKLLSISPRLLWDITSPRGPLPVVKIGVRTIYSVRDLEEFIESRKGGPEA